MQLEQISEDEFFEGLNERIAALADEIRETSANIAENPDSSTYHMDRFMYPLSVMRKLQHIRDKARAFKQHENEDVVYVKKTSQHEKAKYFYLPKSQFDRSNLPEIIRELEKREQTDGDLGYIG